MVDKGASWFALCLLLVGCGASKKQTATRDYSSEKVDWFVESERFIQSCMFKGGFDYSPRVASKQALNFNFDNLLDPRVYLKSLKTRAAFDLAPEEFDVKSWIEFDQRKPLSRQEVLRSQYLYGLDEKPGCVDKARVALGDRSFEGATDRYFEANESRLAKLDSDPRFRRLDEAFSRCTKKVGSPIPSLLVVYPYRLKSLIDKSLERPVDPLEPIELQVTHEAVLKLDRQIYAAYVECASPISAQAIDRMNFFLD